MTLIGSGRSGWVDSVHYLAAHIEFLGVFTPEGGGEPMANPGATVFGAMLLHDGVSRNWLARSVMTRNNAHAILSNTTDSVNGLRAMLGAHLTT